MPNWCCGILKVREGIKKYISKEVMMRMATCNNCKYNKTNADELYCELKRIQNLPCKLDEKQSKKIQQCDCWHYKQATRKENHNAMLNLFKYAGY